MEQTKQSPLQNLAYINQKCMQAKAAGVFDEVEITCLWNALDAIHHELLIQEFPAFANMSASNKASTRQGRAVAQDELFG